MPTTIVSHFARNTQPRGGGEGVIRMGLSCLRKTIARPHTIKKTHTKKEHTTQQIKPHKEAIRPTGIPTIWSIYTNWHNKQQPLYVNRLNHWNSHRSIRLFVWFNLLRCVCVCSVRGLACLYTKPHTNTSSHAMYKHTTQQIRPHKQAIRPNRNW